MSQPEPGQDELPASIKSARSLLFDYGTEGEAQLRMLVAFIRDDNEALPKAYWVDIIQKIIAQSNQTARQDALDKLKTEALHGTLTVTDSGLSVHGSFIPTASLDFDQTAEAIRGRMEERS